MSSDDGETSTLFTVSTPDDGLRRVNFYLADDLPDNLSNWLVEAIEAHSGRVHNKGKSSLPVRGYILVDPTSEEAKKLVKRSAENLKKPGTRHVVDWKFVPACIAANRILLPKDIPEGTGVFHKVGSNDGWPVMIWNKGDSGMLLRLAYTLSLHGAELVEDEKDAQFIICDPKSKAFQRLTEKYLADKSTYVEPPAWITQTINSGRVKATAKQAVQLATSPRSSRPEPYTEEDDQHLAEFLAKEVPVDVKYTSSRLGMNNYTKLVNDPDRYPWSARHPAQSWRERYKKRRDEIDQRIRKILARKPKRDAPDYEEIQLPAPKRTKASREDSEDDVPPLASSSKPSARSVLGAGSSQANRAGPSSSGTSLRVSSSQAKTQSSSQARRGTSKPESPRGRAAAAVWMSDDDDGAPLPLPHEASTSQSHKIRPSQNEKSVPVENSQSPIQKNTATQPKKLREKPSSGSSERAVVDSDQQFPTEERPARQNSVSQRNPSQEPSGSVKDEEEPLPDSMNEVLGPDSFQLTGQEEAGPSQNELTPEPHIDEEMLAPDAPPLPRSPTLKEETSLDPFPEPEPELEPEPEPSEVEQKREPVSDPAPVTRVLRSRSVSVQPLSKPTSKKKGKATRDTQAQAQPLQTVVESPPGASGRDEAEPQNEGPDDKEEEVPARRTRSQSKKVTLGRPDYPATRKRNGLATRFPGRRSVSVSEAEDINHADAGDAAEEHQSLNDEEEEQIVSSQVQPDADNSYGQEDEPLDGVALTDDVPRDDQGVDGQTDNMMAGGFTQDILEQRERTMALGRRLSHRYELNFEDDQHEDAIRAGPETQMLLQERQHTIEAGRRAMASRTPSFGSWADTSHPGDRVPAAFKGKGKARQHDMEVDFPEAVRDAPSPSRSAPSFSPRALGHQRSPHLHGRGGAPGHPPMPNGSPAHSQGEAMITEEEDSDAHFAGLDSVIARALRKLATRYRFSACEVRQKYELHSQDLAAAKMALESNRRILDEDTLFQDDFI